MDAKKTTELIEFELVTNSKKAIAGIQRFQKIASNQLNEAKKDTDKLSSATAKFHAQLKTNGRASKFVGDLKSNYAALTANIKKGEEQVAHLRSQMEGASKAERKNILATIKAVKEAQDIKGKKKAAKEVETQIDDLEKEFNVEGLEESAQKAGSELASPIQTVLDKDAVAAFKYGANLISGSFDVGSKGLSKFATLMKNKGEKTVKGGVAGGKLVGGALKAGGSGLEAIANVLTKLGPLISIASSFMMSFVKILIDSESAVKDFNRQILTTAGTGEFLIRNFDNIGDATKDLEKNLRKVRDGSISTANTMLGITKEAGQNFASSLTNEGVSLKKLGAAMDSASGHSKDFEGAVQTAVFSSRALGVSLNEVGQLQGELMSNMGYGLDKVQASFQDILEASQEAGIASNKFFQIIRGFSADLNLFSLRMEDVTKVMKVLGKTMDPRNAQKFLSLATSQFTGGTRENLKAVVIGGKQSRAIGEADIADKIDGLKSAIKEALGNTPEANDAMLDLVKIISDPKRDPRAIAKWNLKNGSKIQGNLMENILNVANTRTSIGTGNEVDLASTVQDWSIFSKVALANLNAMNIVGKKLADVTGEDILAMQDQGAGSQEFITGLKKWQEGIIQAEEEFIDRVKNNAATEADKSKLKSLNITSTGADAEKDIRAALAGPKGEENFWRAMTTSEKDLLAHSEKQIDYQKETAGFQVSLMDKLAGMTDVLLNQIYGILVDIWDTIVDAVAWLTKSDTYTLSQGKLAGTKTKDAEIQKVVSEATTVDQAQKGLGEISTRILGQVNEAGRQFDEANAALKKEKALGKNADAEKIAELEGTIKKLTPLVEYGKQYNSRQDILGGGLLQAINRIDQGKKLAEAAGIKVPAPGEAPKLAPTVQLDTPVGKPRIDPSLMAQIDTTATPQTKDVRVIIDMHPEAEKVIKATAVDAVAQFNRDTRKR